MTTTRDHQFTAEQKAQYDSLAREGRTAYDALRWAGLDHAQAWGQVDGEYETKDEYFARRTAENAAYRADKENAR